MPQPNGEIGFCNLLPGRSRFFRAPLCLTDLISSLMPYEEGWLGRPVIKASINGVRGKFLIDTGANEPVVKMKAVRLCGIGLSARTKPAGFAGNDALTQLKLVDGDVTTEIEGARITWSNVPVLSGLGSDEWF